MAVRKQVRYTKSAQSPKVKSGARVVVSQALVKKGKRNLRAKSHVNKGDEVIIISGADKGKIGKILEVFRDKGKLIVEGVNIVKRHRRASGPGQEGEIVEMEAPIFAAKVMHWDSQNKKASRVGHKLTEAGKKVRILKTSGEQID
jgi:large subunit ribosomal protein L24